MKMTRRTLFLIAGSNAAMVAAAGALTKRQRQEQR